MSALSKWLAVTGNIKLSAKGSWGTLLLSNQESPWVYMTMCTTLCNPYRFICQALMPWLVFSVLSTCIALSCYTSLGGEACVRSFLRSHAGRLSFSQYKSHVFSMWDSRLSRRKSHNRVSREGGNFNTCGIVHFEGAALHMPCFVFKWLKWGRGVGWARRR